MATLKTNRLSGAGVPFRSYSAAPTPSLLTKRSTMAVDKPARPKKIQGMRYTRQMMQQKSEAILRLRASMSEMVLKELMERDRCVFYQRIFIFSRNFLGCPPKRFLMKRTIATSDVRTSENVNNSDIKTSNVSDDIGVPKKATENILGLAFSPSMTSTDIRGSRVEKISILDEERKRDSMARESLNKRPSESTAAALDMSEECEEEQIIESSEKSERECHASDLTASHESLDYRRPFDVEMQFFDLLQKKTREIVKRVEDKMLGEDRFSGLTLLMHKYTLFILEGSEDSITEFCNGLLTTGEPIFTDHRVVLVENRIGQVYFDSMVYKRANPVYLSEKPPINFDDDLEFMTKQHFQTVQKIRLLMEKVSDELLKKQDTVMEADSFAPSVGSKASKSQKSLIKKAMSSVKRKRKLGKRKRRMSIKSAKSIIEDNLQNMESSEETLSEEEEEGRDEADEQGDTVYDGVEELDEEQPVTAFDDDQLSTMVSGQTLLSVKTTDDLNRSMMSLSSSRGTLAANLNAAQSNLTYQQSNFVEEAETEDFDGEEEERRHSAVPSGRDTYESHEILQENSGLMNLDLLTDDGAAIASGSLPQDYYFSIVPDFESTHQSLLTGGISIKKTDMSMLFPPELLPTGQYNKLLPEVQRVDLIFASKRFYPNLKEFVRYSEEVPEIMNNVPLLWPPPFHYLPLNVFQHFEYDVNLNFSDYLTLDYKNDDEEEEDAPKNTIIEEVKNVIPKRNIPENVADDPVKSDQKNIPENEV